MPPNTIRTIIENNMVFEETTQRRLVSMLDMPRDLHKRFSTQIFLPGWLPNSWLLADHEGITWYQIRDWIPIHTNWLLRKGADERTALTPAWLNGNNPIGCGQDFDPGVRFYLPDAKFLLRVNAYEHNGTVQGGDSYLFAISKQMPDFLLHPCVPNVFAADDDGSGTLCFGDQQLPPVRIHTVGLEAYTAGIMEAWLAGGWNSDLFGDLPNQDDIDVWLEYDPKTMTQSRLPEKYDWETNGLILLDATKKEQEVINEYFESA